MTLLGNLPDSKVRGVLESLDALGFDAFAETEKGYQTQVIIRDNISDDTFDALYDLLMK